MYRRKSFFRLCGLLCALCLSLIVAGCGGQASEGPADLVPELCQGVYGAGLMFVTIVNRGSDAGPSTMTITYKSASPFMPRVHLQVKTPAIPAGNEFWLTVELPTTPGGEDFITPVGIITITADATHVLPEINRADQTHFTYCQDGR